jgi:hypothetical protein
MNTIGKLVADLALSGLGLTTYAQTTPMAQDCAMADGTVKDVKMKDKTRKGKIGDGKMIKKRK